ncbi:hypothetical protein HYALB_00003674 [Hymenoscyphus albidus]|uniref:Uncharacterized protein n=1 Tax=Hymenoscyphus albidus TaxID=595503 RepID=A0A9N9LLW5_9HELO|nr:hypothetical protein HYALB_00003674 [Hymenoscyphus albidus]
MQETDENDQVSRGLSQEYPGESETTTNEQLEEHQFQQEPMNQMDERQMEMEMQYSQAEAEAQAEAQTSYHQTPHDQYMASRQLHIEQLTQNERQIQEQWVHAQLYLCGGCVAGFAWYQNGAGYRCMGDNHYVTDALLAEGMGGWYTREIDAYTPREVWAGPFYALEQQDQGIYELDKPQLTIKADQLVPKEA